jgi:hypothetical protein
MAVTFVGSRVPRGQISQRGRLMVFDLGPVAAVTHARSML